MPQSPRSRDTGANIFTALEVQRFAARNAFGSFLALVIRRSSGDVANLMTFMRIRHCALRAIDRVVGAMFRGSLPTYLHGEWIWLSRECWSSIYGRYEPRVTKAIASHLRRGGRFWDVGANVGILSLFASKIVGPSGSVCAFEPSPGVVEQLRRNVRSTAIEVLPIGIGNEDGVRTFAAQGTSTSASFHKAVTAINERYTPDQPITEISVVIRRLDTVLAHCAPPSLLKIDIEGFELEAIKGASCLLSSHCPTMLIEVHPEQLALSGGSEKELFERLRAHRYTWTVIDRNVNGLYTVLALPQIATKNSRQ
ncbi:FkbM family methyltransferase [Rhodoplanes sp. Z2-YC6860]|nr:FkbM family methyltransferase [Rhodoplanes sp. Z2-YC6860]